MKPSTDWKETIPEGEAERLERHAETLRDLAAGAARGGKVDRALHAKAHLGVEAEVTVLPDLPDEARAGLFAAPGAYKAYVRFSNGSGLRKPDRAPDVRGIAIKVVGARGKKIIPGLEDAKTQDFLLVRGPSTPFRNADEFVTFVRFAYQPWRLPALPFQLGAGRFVTIARELSKGFGVPLKTLATTPFYSAAPIKLGRYAVHLGLLPSAASALHDASIELGPELADTLRAGSVSYDLAVQFFVDEKTTPIEDGSVEWKEADAPFVKVGRLVIPQQDVTSPRGQAIASAIEGWSFDPWHATEEMRPLGNLMRARNHAYRLSGQGRHATAEPDGSETFG